jgi:hypothetical protein
MDRVPFVDQSGLYALEAFFQWKKRRAHILIIGLIPALG